MNNNLIMLIACLLTTQIAYTVHQRIIPIYLTEIIEKYVPSGTDLSNPNIANIPLEERKRDADIIEEKRTLLTAYKNLSNFLEKLRSDSKKPQFSNSTHLTKPFVWSEQEASSVRNKAETDRFEMLQWRAQQKSDSYRNQKEFEAVLEALRKSSERERKAFEAELEALRESSERERKTFEVELEALRKSSERERKAFEAELEE